MMLKIYRLFTTLLCVSLAMSSCTDDVLLDSSYIGDGEAEITAEITFKPLYPALSSRSVTGGTPGNALKEIDNLMLLFYNTKNELVYRLPYSDPAIEKTTNKPADQPGTDKEHVAETSTLKATVKIPKIKYGRYYIYAVANMPESVLTEEAVSTPDKLKTITLTWNESDIAANKQMFGYFSESNSSVGFNAPQMTVNQGSVKLHAWIKRAASKVTVAFNGTKLKEGVEIFIKSVAIKDIPVNCYLGANNPAEPDKKIPLIKEGQVMTYGTGDTYTPQWIGYISKDHPINGYDQDIVNDTKLTNEAKLEQLHSENINALYLFENLQGEGEENSPSDKHQQVNDQHKQDGIVSYPDGTDPTNIAWKDAKMYGSYIEVKAFYRCSNSDGTINKAEGEGEITYRFMLGKDTELDYNTERNYHYKLTLNFNGYANDVDWHIDYKKDPENILRFPRPFYISYLYGQSTMVPMEFETDEDMVITKVTAEITSNNWAPSFLPGQTKYSFNGTPNTQPSSWWNDQYALYVSASDDPVGRKYNGFLSLRKPLNLLVVPQNGTGALGMDANEKHYNDNNLGSRTYEGDEVKISEIPLFEAIYKDQLHVQREGRTYYVKMPIWTRARNLITKTAFTGNNPYDSYYRDAKIHVEIELSNSDGSKKITLKSDEADLTGTQPGGTPADKDILVKQVRRLVNPKGIWRSANNSADFHVVLKVLKSVDDVTFTDLKSDGPWRAYVIRDTESDDKTGDGGFISLKGAAGTTVGHTTFDFNGHTITRKCIEGVDNTEMDFTVKFSKIKPTRPRYAIIRVEYNYNSCYHLIFVRQGYDADNIIDGGVKWCTANMYDQTNLAKTPLDEGSLFRFGNWNGIKSENNVNKGKNPWIKIVPDDFKNNVGNNLTMTDGTTKNWGDITSKDPKTESFEDPKNTKYRFADWDDYRTLVPKDLNNAEEVANFKIKVGYGVLYGDGATETADSLDVAFGYKYDEKNKGVSSKGMRGCFAYNVETGKNIFFPIGSSGYGHRLRQLDNVPQGGTLRYSSANRWGYFNANVGPYSPYGVYCAPLFFDVFRSPGAIYWFQTGIGKPTDDDGLYVAWDINYATFDFNRITLTNVHSSTGADACFIRCIEK
ncbi:hypothetical protein [uncultured Duncaniella sp.]|uniref:hypothetical protein n=1 Tax=uncultured Duncaniella sp. TaxID=2768039 RepID=UPI0025FC4EDF|nr:hypothetical protein [uncultured Duncaniella sp.]